LTKRVTILTIVLGGAILVGAVIVVVARSENGSGSGSTAKQGERTATASLTAPAAAAVWPWPRAARDKAIIWAVGDGADGGVNGAKVAGLIARARPDRLLYLGDVYDTGSAAEFATHYAPSFGRLAKRTAPTPGNHEWPRRETGYRPYWRSFLAANPPGYYGFKLAGWELLSLNSEAPHGRASAQLRWLNRRLRGRGTCRLAFWHRPRYSAGTHGDQVDVEPFWDALEGHARVVVNGHDHNMQRLRPTRGMVGLIAGAGGHSLYPLNRRYRRLAFANDAAYGALRLELTPGRAAYTFVSASGRTLDAGRVRCRRA